MELSAEENSNNSLIRISDVLFSSVLKTCGAVLLERGQTQSIKLAKKRALRDVAHYIQLNSGGQKISERKILKKINNMKTRIKWKLHSNKTGQKRHSLNTGEEIFYELMAPDEAQDIKANNNTSVEEEDNTLLYSQEPVSSIPEKHGYVYNSLEFVNTTTIEPPEIKHELDATDVDITNLTNDELQRMVLIKQLELCDKQKNLLNKFENLLVQVDSLVTKYK